MMAMARAIEKNAREWLIAITPLLERMADNDPLCDQEVKDARDRVLVAACRRLERILEGDLPTAGVELVGTRSVRS